MATWKKVVVSGSNVSQLNNDAGYLTSATIPAKNAFATASYAGTALIADSPSGSLNFASSSTQGLTISATAGTDTLTFGLSAIPNASLANSSVTVGSTNIALGATSTTLAGLTSVSSTAFTGSLQGTASTASFVTSSNVFGPNGANSILSSSFAQTASFATTTTTATNATNVAVTDTTTGTGPYYIMFADGTTGNRAARVDSATLTFNATANLLTVTASYASQSLSSSFASSVPYTGITGVPSGLVSGSSQITYSGISGIPANIVSASVLSSPAQGEALLTTNGVAGSTIDLGLQTTDSPTFAGVTAGNITVGVTNDNTINTTSGDLTIQPNVILNSNLTVIGTASFQNTTSLQVADRFVLFASGSNTTGDGGIVVQQATQDVGELFGWDSGLSRWAVTSSFTAAGGTFTPDAIMALAILSSSLTPTTAARYNAAGNIYVSSGDESIWIYS
jgi:hypothetical protein